MDGRRRQWVPLSAQWPFDRTGTKLLDELGPGALAVWPAYLTACKRNSTQGRIQYGTDLQGWDTLGFPELDPFGWTLNDLWTVTGHMKKTRRMKYGRMLHVISTTWEDWTKTQPRHVGRHRNPTTTPQNTKPKRTIHATYTGNSFTYDSDSDSDIREEAAKPLHDAIVYGLVDAFGWDRSQVTERTWGKLHATGKLLRQVGADPDEIPARVARYRELYPEWACTPFSVADHWATLDPADTSAARFPACPTDGACQGRTWIESNGVMVPCPDCRATWAS